MWWCQCQDQKPWSGYRGSTSLVPVDQNLFVFLFNLNTNWRLIMLGWKYSLQDRDKRKEKCTQILATFTQPQFFPHRTSLHGRTLTDWSTSRLNHQETSQRMVYTVHTVQCIEQRSWRNKATTLQMHGTTLMAFFHYSAKLQNIPSHAFEVLRYFLELFCTSHLCPSGTIIKQRRGKHQQQQPWDSFPETESLYTSWAIFAPWILVTHSNSHRKLIWTGFTGQGCGQQVTLLPMKVLYSI